MMKKLFSAVLTLTMVALLCIPAFATNDNEDVDTQRAHDLDYKLVEVNREERTRVHIGKAGGQPSGGYNLPAGSYLSWTPGGDSASITLSLTWGVVSGSLDVGTTNMGSVGTVVPALANQTCWLHVYKDLTIIQYEIYQRPAGTSWEWRSTGEYTTRIIEGTVYLQCRAY